MQRCSAESFRKPVLCYDPDVMETYRLIVSHWPIFEETNLAKSHPVFLTPKAKYRKSESVWFTKGPVGRNKLASVTKSLCESIESLKDKRITNKTGRAVGITRMEEALVPRETGMEHTGHRDAKSYEKYNRESKVPSSKAVQKIISGGLPGERLLYADVIAADKKVMPLLCHLFMNV